MEAPQWREEAGGTFVAETAEFIIQVRRTARRQHVRFFVLKRTDVLIGSGRTADIRAAMSAAQEMAGRLTGTRKSDRPRLMVVDDDQEMRGAIADTLRAGLTTSWRLPAARARCVGLKGSRSQRRSLQRSTFPAAWMDWSWLLLRESCFPGLPSC